MERRFYKPEDVPIGEQVRQPGLEDIWERIESAKPGSIFRLVDKEGLKFNEYLRCFETLMIPVIGKDFAPFPSRKDEDFFYRAKALFYWGGIIVWDEDQETTEIIITADGLTQGRSPFECGMNDWVFDCMGYKFCCQGGYLIESGYKISVSPMITKDGQSRIAEGFYISIPITERNKPDTPPMTLEEAIEHALSKAEALGDTPCGLQHSQLAKWLQELRARREDESDADSELWRKAYA